MALTKQFAVDQQVKIIAGPKKGKTAKILAIVFYAETDQLWVRIGRGAPTLISIAALQSKMDAP